MKMCEYSWYHCFTSGYKNYNCYLRTYTSRILFFQIRLLSNLKNTFHSYFGEMEILKRTQTRNNLETLQEEVYQRLCTCSLDFRNNKRLTPKQICFPIRFIDIGWENNSNMEYFAKVNTKCAFWSKNINTTILSTCGTFRQNMFSIVQEWLYKTAEDNRMVISRQFSTSLRKLHC